MSKKSELPLFGLVMIGKNEAATISRALDSVKPLIGAWTYCDTGSSDNTVELVRQHLGHLPGKVYRHRFRDFGHNLTLAHERARGTARWLLWIHADMEVVAVPECRTWFARRRGMKADGFNVNVSDHGTNYLLPLIMDGSLPWRYVGPTHEYLEVNGRTILPLTGIYVVHHSDGANREEKFARDIELLTPGFQAGDPRSTFYMAETLRYSGNELPAIVAYTMRAEMGGWDEEVWYSKYQAAALKRDIDGLFEVWRERPWRHEPLTAAGRIVAEQDPSAGGDRLFLESIR